MRSYRGTNIGINKKTVERDKVYMLVEIGFPSNKDIVDHNYNKDNINEVKLAIVIYKMAHHLLSRTAGLE